MEKKPMKSIFTLTFAIEIVGFEVWHDCKEGWLALGQCEHGLKLQYEFYPGHKYEINILIWPHTAKIFCDDQYCWVRTWRFLERCWFTFSIRHVLAVRVEKFRDFTIFITPTRGMAALSANARNDNSVEVFIPPLRFGERRYFGQVLDKTDFGTITSAMFMKEVIWQAVLPFIPATVYDGQFDLPQNVSDIRHQDAILDRVQFVTLNYDKLQELRLAQSMHVKVTSSHDKGASKISNHAQATNKSKEKKEPQKCSITLSGDAILAGTGRIVPFVSAGDEEPGEIIVLISSANLPAPDDLPIIFVNVDTLFDVPIEEFKKLGILQLYTRWVLGEETHDSEAQDIVFKKDVKVGNINFDDHHVLLLEPSFASEVVALFLDQPYEVQLRGIRHHSVSTKTPNIFGYERTDITFNSKVIPPREIEETDFVIARTIIKASKLSDGCSCLIREEFPLYPPIQAIDVMNPAQCTNYINAVRSNMRPKLVVPTHVILKAQMSLEVSIGLVGCKPPKLNTCYSRLFALVDKPEDSLTLIQLVSEINAKLTTARAQELLSGFSIDTGNKVFLYIEGPRNGKILEIWTKTEEIYPRIRTVYSSYARYVTRIYPEFIQSATPFAIIRMHVCINVLLACPAVYVRPTLPLPARSALLKLGRLLAGGLKDPPSRCHLPSLSELRSFRLELCTPMRPPPTKKKEQNIIYSLNTSE